ncbi:MAG: PAS domain-containing protein [Polyangiaceae bacterium]|nr:PAS domain-containing protein [Polyangiaceae bacterium]
MWAWLARARARAARSGAGAAHGARSQKSPLTLRVAAYAFGIELPFSLLVPVAYLRLFHIGDPLVQKRVLAAIFAVYLIKTGLLVALLARMLRPIERLRRDPGPPSAALVLEAGRAAYDAPLGFSAAWATSWALLFAPVTAALPWLAPGLSAVDLRRVVATALFSVACFAAALPLAYGILGRLLSPAAGLISLVARERGLEIPGRMSSLAGRLVVLGVCLAVAPTSWMVGMVLAEGDQSVSQGAWITLGVFALVPIAWAPVCAGFLAGALASPLRQVGAVIDSIVQRGDAERLERIPVHFKDEIGSLAAGVNAMVDSLQDKSARIRSYITERERLLEDAARRAAQLQAVLDNLVEGVFACDAGGRLTMINASGLRLVGLSGLPEGGISMEELHERVRARHPDGPPLALEEAPMSRALAGETVLHEEDFIIQPASRRELYLRSCAAPIRDERGAILGAVVVARDVTELRQLDLVKDQFIRVGAHELKTPVAIMKGYALALLRNPDELSPPRRKMLEAIDRGADRMSRIVDDLLAISQVSLDVLHVSDEPIDLGRLVEEAVERAAAKTSQHALHLVTECPGPLRARGDPERLRQVLGSLLENAVKYSPDGGDIDVTVSVAPAGAPRREATVSVRDHGVGIPADKHDRIFERFFRAHTDTPHDYGGMGVGLSLARDMIARQGGRIWFESEEGRGSTFHFTVPLEGEEPARG